MKTKSYNTQSALQIENECIKHSLSEEDAQIIYNNYLQYLEDYKNGVISIYLTPRQYATFCIEWADTCRSLGGGIIGY